MLQGALFHASDIVNKQLLYGDLRTTTESSVIVTLKFSCSGERVRGGTVGEIHQKKERNDRSSESNRSRLTSVRRSGIFRPSTAYYSLIILFVRLVWTVAAR